MLVCFPALFISSGSFLYKKILTKSYLDHQKLFHSIYLKNKFKIISKNVLIKYLIYFV